MSKISSKIKIIFKALTANLADFSSLLSNLRLAALAKSDDKNAKTTYSQTDLPARSRPLFRRPKGCDDYKKSHNDKRNSRANLSLKNAGIL